MLVNKADGWQWLSQWLTIIWSNGPTASHESWWKRKNTARSHLKFSFLSLAGADTPHLCRNLNSTGGAAQVSTCTRAQSRACFIPILSVSVFVWKILKDFPRWKENITPIQNCCFGLFLLSPHSIFKEYQHVEFREQEDLYVIRCVQISSPCLLSSVDFECLKVTSSSSTFMLLKQVFFSHVFMLVLIEDKEGLWYCVVKSDDISHVFMLWGLKELFLSNSVLCVDRLCHLSGCTFSH